MVSKHDCPVTACNCLTYFTFGVQFASNILSAAYLPVCSRALDRVLREAASSGSFNWMPGDGELEQVRATRPEVWQMCAGSNMLRKAACLEKQ